MTTTITKQPDTSQARVGQPEKGKQGKRISEKTRQEIIESFKEGFTKSEIAKLLNVSRGTVTSVINKAGARAAQSLAREVKQEGRTIAHSNSYHSPSLAELKTPGTPAAALMESHRQMLMQAITKASADIAAFESRLLKLQRKIQEEYAQYHGSMIARWAAYERCWEDELIEKLGAHTIADISLIMQEKLKRAAKKTGECFATFELLKTVDYVIED